MKNSSVRVWDIKNSCIRKVNSLKYDRSGKLVSIIVFLNSNENLVEEMPTSDPSSFILLRNTGLNYTKGDKRQMFEGDIARVFNDYGEQYFAPIIYGTDYDYPAFDLDVRYVPNSYSYESNILSTILATDTEENIEYAGVLYKDSKLLNKFR